MNRVFGTLVFAATVMAGGTAFAFECKRGEASFDKPGGFPERALTMVVPYGPAGGSGQVAAAMAEAEDGDVVLLAPATASFDQYDSFERRGEDFIAEVTKRL